MHIYFKQLYAIEFVMVKISLKMLPQLIQEEGKIQIALYPIKKLNL